MARSLTTGRSCPTAASLRASTSSADQPDASPSDRRWKALTLQANAAFAAQRWEEADRLYLEALGEADAVFRSYRIGAPVGNADPVPMLVTAIANLADCCLERGQPGRAADYLMAVSRRLCRVIERADTRRDVREQCLIHLRPLVFELLDKLPRAGWSEERTADAIAQIRARALRHPIPDESIH
ncbi:MAG: hypothetical protein AB7G13_28080 [Lautropia sp.]